LAAHVGFAQWTSQEWIYLGFSVFLITLAISRWTARSGPWTIFVAVLPLFWWADSFDLVPAMVGRSLAWAACGIVIASILARELPAGDRFDAATSALIGVFAIGAAILYLQTPTWIGATRVVYLPGWRSLLAIGAAAALALAAATRRYPDRGALWWLAAALATPFVATRLLPGPSDDLSTLGGNFRPALVVLLPLALLAVEARLSERRKTFGFAITAMIAIVCFQVWESKDLLSVAWVFLGGSVLLGAAILLTRMLSARPPATAHEGGP
jgi:hypothetical protein